MFPRRASFSAHFTVFRQDLKLLSFCSFLFFSSSDELHWQRSDTNWADLGGTCLVQISGGCRPAPLHREQTDSSVWWLWCKETLSTVQLNQWVVTNLCACVCLSMKHMVPLRLEEAVNDSATRHDGWDSTEYEQSCCIYLTETQTDTSTFSLRPYKKHFFPHLTSKAEAFRDKC